MRIKRVRRLEIDPSQLVHFLKGTSKIIEGALPDTAELWGMDIDHRTGSLILFVQDESFAKIDIGQIPPEHIVIFQERRELPEVNMHLVGHSKSRRRPRK